MCGFILSFVAELLDTMIMSKKDTDKTLETLNDQELDEVQGGGGMSRYVFRCPICNKCFTISCGNAHSFRCGMIAVATFSGTQTSYSTRNVQ